MDCELCSTAGQGGGATRCQRCGFDTTLPPDVKRFLVSLTGFRPGELLEGRYRIDRILGYGGLSVVYKAHDEVLGEEVAIKVINRGRMGEDNKLITDIRRDIVTTRKLAHHDIVKIYDFHKTDTCGFLTMEFVPGKDVASLLTERGKLGEAEVCRMAAQVAEALSYAHANGVIHCDIKPANMLLAENGRIKIADFGISRLMQEENSGLTGLVVGTPAYMAPEQIRGERPGPRTDMYALGIVMWHCLMGSPPFMKGDIAYQHVHMPLPPMTGISPDVERIVLTAAAKAIEDRFPSMTVMVQELHEVLRRVAPVVDATLVQTPPPGLAASLAHPPPPLAGTVLQASPAEPAGTVVQTPPPVPAGTVVQTAPPVPAGTVVQTAPPVPAGTVVQTAPPAPAGTVVQTPPPRPAVAAAQAPPPQPVPAPEPPPPRPPGGVGPAAAGGRLPPASGGPTGGQELPAPPAPAKTRTAALVAVAFLLAGAAAWGLFFRSPDAGKPGEPRLTSPGGIPPVSTPPALLGTAPPPEPPSPGVGSPAAPRTAAPGAGAVVGVTAGASVAAVSDLRAERAAAPPAAPTPTAVPAPPASVPPPLSRPAPRGTEAPVSPLTRTGATEPTPVPTPVPASGAPSPAVGRSAAPAPPPVSVPTQPPAPVQPPVTEKQPTPAPPPAAQSGTAENTVPPMQARTPEPGPSIKPAAPESGQAEPSPPPAARVIDLTPIQLTALPRGRWCDVHVRAVGTGLPMRSARSEVERRLTAERSADLDAYRRIAENVKGIQVSGGSTVKDFVTLDASYKTRVDAVIRGARRVDSQKNADGSWSTVMELNLAGMCDVIQAGTP